MLYTLFRYPPLPAGSRFRAPTDPGVFYGAHEKRTACAEHGFWQWRLLTDSPALIEIAPKERTLFQAAVRARSVDLRIKPFVRDQQKGACTAILTPRAFAKKNPLTQETWSLPVKRTHVLWKPQLSKQQGFEFTFTS